MKIFLFYIVIAFLNGKIRVGLDKAEIEQVAKSHEHALKISRRDIAYLLANRDKPDLVGGTILLLVKSYSVYESEG